MPTNLLLFTIELELLLDMISILPCMMLFADMGGRKFKLGRIQKNAERQNPTALTVSIPRDAVSVQVSPGLSLSCCTPFLSNALQHSDQIDIDSYTN